MSCILTGLARVSRVSLQRPQVVEGSGPRAPLLSHFAHFNQSRVCSSRKFARASRQQCAAASLPRTAFARVCRRVRCSASRRVRAGRPASLRARGAWRSRWRAAECCKSVRTFMLAWHHLAMCGTWRITQLALRGCAGQRATGACWPACSRARGRSRSRAPAWPGIAGAHVVRKSPFSMEREGE